MGLFETDFETFMQGLTTQVIPLEFTQKLTTAEFLHTLFAEVKELSQVQGKMREEIYADFDKKFNELSTSLLNDNSYFQKYIREIHEYCVNYLTKMLGDSIAYISFGLEDGYLVAYVPESLEQITFTTDMDYNSPNYGKLIMMY